MRSELIPPAKNNVLSSAFSTESQKKQWCPYALALALVLGLAAFTPSTQGQTFTVLHTFGGPDGDNSNHGAGLTWDSAGNLYGTTDFGGYLACNGAGCGTVYKLDRNGKETVLHRFRGTPDGAYPFAGVIRDAAGNLYGTTLEGGTSGNGTVFKVDSTGNETVLHSFTGLADGGFPRAGVVRDSAGNLYGTTEMGGASNKGTVYKLDATGKETVLHSFTGGTDGANPQVGVIQDKAGNLYGIAGPLFKINKSGKETVLYNFPEGFIAYAGLIFCGDALCGTTAYGGSGLGTVFKLDQREEFTVLYNFTGGTDGGYPLAGVIQDAAGNLYGETAVGGWLGCGDEGCGTVFKLSPAGEETVLYTFYDGFDGGFPAGGLVRDAAGNLYGTTTSGGNFGRCNEPFYNGCGTIFKLTP